VIDEQRFDEIIGDKPRELSPLEAANHIAGLCAGVCHAARDVMRAIDERDRLIAKHLSHSGANQ
jgi:hypothetical protein